MLIFAAAVPPRIHSVTGDGRYTARKGSGVSLNCSASGHPPPNIHWERQVRPERPSNPRFAARNGHPNSSGGKFEPSIHKEFSGKIPCSSILTIKILLSNSHHYCLEACFRTQISAYTYTQGIHKVCMHRRGTGVMEKRMK